MRPVIQQKHQEEWAPGEGREKFWGCCGRFHRGVFLLGLWFVSMPMVLVILTKVGNWIWGSFRDNGSQKPILAEVTPLYHLVLVICSLSCWAQVVPAALGSFSVVRTQGLPNTNSPCPPLLTGWFFGMVIVCPTQAWQFHSPISQPSYIE
jgi:hypothetical protein